MSVLRLGFFTLSNISKYKRKRKEKDKRKEKEKIPP
jgi:hypothetical protein